MVCGTASDAGKSTLVTALCRSLARRGVLKPTGERASQVVVRGHPIGVMTAAEYHAAKPGLLGTVLDALGDLRSRFDVVLCEGAGSPAEINLLDHDIANLRIAAEAGLPAVVVGDIDRGGSRATVP